MSSKNIFEKIWRFEYTKQVLLTYVIISLALFIMEFLVIGELQISFLVTYFGLFYIAPYIRHGISTIFEQFHIKLRFRSLLIPWILFLIILIYVMLFFTTGILLPEPTITRFAFSISIIVNILISINPLIRIFAVGFHRRKIEIFPINRLEFAAMEHLKQGKLKFSELKERIKGTFNIFIDKVYFDEETAKSSIYHLCGLRYADIKNESICLTETGQAQTRIWEDTINQQVGRFNKILNSNAVLIRSFVGLFVISLFKIVLGMFNSQSLMAEGFENFLDCVAVILIGIGIKFDKEKAVNIILVCLMTFMGISIILDAIGALFSPQPVSNSYIIIIISLISIFLNTYLRTLKNFVGKKNRNSSLVASAIDSRVNILLSIGIITGAIFSDFGTSIGMPGFYYLDPIIAIIVCVLIFKEVFEIITEFITGDGKEEEFENFRMSYEETLEEYVIKWILIVFEDQGEGKLTLEELDVIFNNSLKKGEEIYTEFSYFGLYFFKENGLSVIIKKLVNEKILIQLDNGIISVSEKGKRLYSLLYSERLMEDIKDPFDFFFDTHHEAGNIKYRKAKILENYGNRLKR